MYGHLVHIILKVLAWEICNLKWGFAKKVIIKSERQFMYGSNFYESDVRIKLCNVSLCIARILHVAILIMKILNHPCYPIKTDKSKWQTEKNLDFQLPTIFIGPWVNTINWCKGHHCCSTCPAKAQKKAKKTKNAFLTVNIPYVGQPDNHIGCATLMPFASLYCTNPRTNPLNFGKNNVN